MYQIEILTQLRDKFLNPSLIKGSYWDSEQALKQYDLFFGRRNKNKISFVLSDLFKRNLAVVERLKEAEKIQILDWGCGPGTFVRCLLQEYSDTIFQNKTIDLSLLDHSSLAVEFAKKRLLNEQKDKQLNFVSQEVWSQNHSQKAFRIFLFSHVLNENILASTFAQFKSLAAQADLIIGIESGRSEDAKLLGRFRNSFLSEQSDFRVLGPCPHSNLCPLTANEEKNWCHFTFRPPSTDAQDGDWVKVHKSMGIDVRFLSVSFVSFIKANAFFKLNPSSSSDRSSFRVLGTPRDLKGRYQVLTCFESAGVSLKNISKKEDSLWYKETSKKISDNRELLLGLGAPHGEDIKQGEWKKYEC